MGVKKANKTDEKSTFFSLVPTWLLGRLVAVLGRPGCALGASWGVLGRLGGVLGASWAVLGGRLGSVLGESGEVWGVARRCLEGPWGSPCAAGPQGLLANGSVFEGGGDGSGGRAHVGLSFSDWVREESWNRPEAHVGAHDGFKTDAEGHLEEVPMLKAEIGQCFKKSKVSSGTNSGCSETGQETGQLWHPHLDPNRSNFFPRGMSGIVDLS